MDMIEPVATKRQKIWAKIVVLGTILTILAYCGLQPDLKEFWWNVRHIKISINSDTTFNKQSSDLHSFLSEVNFQTRGMGNISASPSNFNVPAMGKESTESNKQTTSEATSPYSRISVWYFDTKTQSLKFASTKFMNEHKRSASSLKIQLYVWDKRDNTFTPDTTIWKSLRALVLHSFDNGDIPKPEKK